MQLAIGEEGKDNRREETGTSHYILRRTNQNVAKHSKDIDSAGVNGNLRDRNSVNGGDGSAGITGKICKEEESNDANGGKGTSGRKCVIVL